jgi:hypothetical protein
MLPQQIPEGMVTDLLVVGSGISPTLMNAANVVSLLASIVAHAGKPPSACAIYRSRVDQG